MKSKKIHKKFAVIPHTKRSKHKATKPNKKTDILKYSEKINVFEKNLSDPTKTGLKANFQNIPRYVISYHVVCFAQSVLSKIESLISLIQHKKRTKKCTKTLHTYAKCYTSLEIFF